MRRHAILPLLALLLGLWVFLASRSLLVLLLVKAALVLVVGGVFAVRRFRRVR